MLRTFKKRKKSKGQSTMEYAILIILIIAVLIAIQAYIKRAVQGRLKSAADDIGMQYSPGNTNVFTNKYTYSKTKDEFGIAGQGVSKSTINEDYVYTNMDMTIINTQLEFWGR